MEMALTNTVSNFNLLLKLAKINNDQVSKIMDIEKNIMDVDLKIMKAFRDMYERLGDLISIQYGGSIAHK